jgi:serine O-acetyltransferase
MEIKNNVGISATVPDWTREYKPFFQWTPSKSFIASIRCYQSITTTKNPIKFSIKKFAVLRYRFWSVVTGADIPLNCNIEGGLMIPHPNGIVIHPYAKIGPNCIIFQQVTIGYKEGSAKGVSVGGNVGIGAGAKVLGDVNIGNNAEIGANAVVLIDVPENRIALGVPAKII